MEADSIATVAKHIVPVARRAEFEEWVRGIDNESRSFPGYQGLEHVHSRGESDDEHYCVFRFDCEDNLSAWMASDERRHWLADDRSFNAEIFTARPYSSLGFWFTPPGGEASGPSNFKMTVATFAAIWPMVHFISPVTGHLLKTPLQSEMVSVGVICVLMTYLVMPIVTRLLGWWLFR